MFISIEEFDKKTREWRKRLNVTDIPKAPKSSALLVLDMQNEFLTDAGQMQVWAGPAIIPYVATLIQVFRKARMPVFFTRHICLEPFRHKDDLLSMRSVGDIGCFLKEGAKSSEIHPSVRPFPEEPIITKYRYSAFYDTPLDTMLRINGVESVFLAGVASNICCDSTARDAFYRGYDVFFPLDANGGLDEASHIETLRTIAMSFGTVCDTNQITQVLTKLNKARK